MESFSTAESLPDHLVGSPQPWATSWTPIAVGGALTAVVSADLLIGGPLRRWDHSVITATQPAGGAGDPAWQAVADLGGSAFLAFVLIAALCIHFMAGRNWRPTAFAAGWVGLIAGVIWLSKTVIGRTPPWSRVDLLHAGGMSYPSGHSTSAAAFLLIAATLATTPGSRLDRITISTVPAVAAAVAIATVHLRYHWPSDAIAGWALGLTLGLLARRFIRRATHQAVPDSTTSSSSTVGS